MESNKKESKPWINYYDMIAMQKFREEFIKGWRHTAGDCKPCKTGKYCK